MKLDVEIYDEYGDGVWAQAKYLAHSSDDVLWTNDIDEAVNFLRHDLEKSNDSKPTDSQTE